MIDIGPFLLRAQRSRTILGKHLLIRCVLTYGANTYTYDLTRIKELSHTRQTFSHKGQVMLDDTDKTLHGLDLEGYKAVISRGLITKAGEEWIALPPLWVVGQQRDSYRDRLECSLSLEGIFDRMGKHKAESTLTLASTDTQTVKDLLTGLADTTLTDGTNTPYSNYPAYTITFDSEDDLIDSFKPADSFRVNENDTRLSKWKELLRYTDCVSRIGNDEEIHIFNPTTSGTDYDNEYSLVQGRDYHNFFSKRFRRRIVSPNYIIFKDFDGNYSGFAKDASADLTDMLEIETHTTRATSDAQCTNLANALLSKRQMEDERGSGVLPFVHFGQEIYDYVNFVDARAGDERAGNVGFITEYYKPGQFNMHIGFGRTPAGVLPLQRYSVETEGEREGFAVEQMKARLFELQSWINEALSYALTNKENIDTLWDDKVWQVDYDKQRMRDFIDFYSMKLTASREMNIPSEAA